jgi:hypothetical protein
LLVKLKGIQGKLLVSAKTLQQQVKSSPSTTHDDNNSSRKLFETTVNECNDLLDEMLTIRPMTFDLLQQSRAGKPVAKLTKLLKDDDDDATNNTDISTTNQLLHVLVQRGHTIILYWNTQMSCRGGPLQLLTTFRRRQAELTRAGQAKPDMWWHLRSCDDGMSYRYVHGAIPDVCQLV